MDRDTTSVMSKVTATLGRNFIRSKEFQEAQMMGLDPVGCDVRATQSLFLDPRRLLTKSIYRIRL